MDGLSLKSSAFWLCWNDGRKWHSSIVYFLLPIVQNTCVYFNSSVQIDEVIRIKAVISFFFKWGWGKKTHILTSPIVQKWFQNIQDMRAAIVTSLAARVYQELERQYWVPAHMAVHQSESRTQLSIMTFTIGINNKFKKKLIRQIKTNINQWLIKMFWSYFWWTDVIIYRWMITVWHIRQTTGSHINNLIEQLCFLVSIVQIMAADVTNWS